MLKKLEIENFKSIYKESIELGQVNVFIGENGCGKTNILEGLGMISAGLANKIGNDELALRGIRVTKPSITFSSFLSENQKNKILFKVHFEHERDVLSMPISFISDDKNDIYSKWKHIEFPIENENDLNSNLTKSTRVQIHDFLNTESFKIYHLSTQILRGIEPRSREIPGIHGENLDLLINSFSKEEMQTLVEHAHFISWLDEIVIDKEDRLRLEGHKLDMSKSTLYFRDKFMQKKNNIFSAENANEGILHILFYLALFISKRTPKLFAIDNIETALNPYLCRKLMEELVKLAKKNDKQVLITTHHPAILDGLNLHDDEQRLFTVSRNNKGHTKVKRIKLKPNAEVDGNRLKLSELWMRGHLGALPQHF